ncbi:GGDEF domain-containing protein [Devosia sp. YIM 151766]|uniref:GGDEF domain-containing protein n=1 Tax=Devosia sp. YIM 151766 TaxID=3017325 RepID=UPI00255C3E1F|nr:GGDEF domain-containing protein [Devosia sp. YIM 151766]WIY54445.1 GGDEF domain-containing protein [Devosia sp. YIM 151766]
MSDQEFIRALGYANAAFDLLKRSQIPPYPQFYELLYTYATGVNPSLNNRINAIFRSGTSPSTDLAETLYNEFLKSDVNDRMSSVSERMHARIESVHDAIDAAMTTANAYSGSLQSAAGDLERDLGGEAMKTLATRLLTETRRMQNTNRELEQKLEASRDDISALQRDLDDVRRESMLDPLTKIANRKSFDEGLADGIAASVRSGDPLCLMLIDIDHFKNFNDTFGHQTGDQVLRLVAMTLKSNIKGKDLAARYGGEEFAAILPSTDLQGAIIVAENIRKAIQAKELLKRSTNEKLGRITASFGVARFRAADSAMTLIERADQCLYAAKHAGRNRVVSEDELVEIDDVSDKNVSIA